MLDKSVEYIDVYMRRPPNSPMLSDALPEGYRFVAFQPGDEKEWAEIETSVLEFDRAVDAMAHFQDYFGRYTEELWRCMFVENAQGEKVATAMAWWGYTDGRRDPWLHWVAVRPEYQGLGLGRAIVAHVVGMMIRIEGHRDFYLHTQTWSHKAIRIYKGMGFEVTREQVGIKQNNNRVDDAIKLLAELGV